MNQNLLTASNLKYIFQPSDLFSLEKKRLLWDIPQLTIDSPGIVLLAGRNGVGKSTLLRCLLGLMKPTTGSIQWFGESKPSQGKIGYLPELPILPPRIKVSELIESLLGLNAEHFKQLEADSSRPETLRISPLLSRPAHLLSKGQQQRLLLTLALSGDPLGFVLDEPFSGLDPWARNELADLLIFLSSKQRFLLISTHECPARMREQIRETWIIESETLKIHPGFALPE